MYLYMLVQANLGVYAYGTDDTNINRYTITGIDYDVIHILLTTHTTHLQEHND